MIQSLILALVYVDPSSTGLLMQILAPVFVLFSVLGGYFKRDVATFFRRLTGRPTREGR